MTNWPVKTLGDVCDFVRGVTFNKADSRSEMKTGFIPLLRATNITEKGLLREDFVFVPKNGVRADQKLMSGDALITIASGSASVVGRSVLVEDPGEMTFGAFCGVLRPSPEILPRYLSHFMSSRSVRTAWSEAAQGTNINNLKRDDILQTECLVPPLEEQKRIVALLDAVTARVTELAACYERARTHANNLFTSALRDALESNPDWPIKTLGEVCDLVGGGTPSKDRPEFYGGEIPWATVRDLNVEILRSTEHSITAEAVKSSSSNIIPSGSVVIATRVGLGKAVIVAQDTAINQDLRGLVVKKPNELMAEYLYWWYLSTVHLVVAAGTGATVQGVKLPFVSGLALPVPPLEEQKQIVARLDSMRAKTSEMVAAYDAKLIAAKNLRQSILEAAFKGDL